MGFESIRFVVHIVVAFYLCGTVLSQYGHYGPVPYEYERREKVYYKLKKDPTQVKPLKITPNNLFGWLNKKNAIRFFLWTRNNPELAHELRFNDVESITSSHFDPRKLTKIIIHGWADGASEVQIGDWLIFMRDAYLKFADINYIAVDYAVYASFFLYVTARPELVAERVTEMLSFMEKNGLELDPLHIVGWSWGAHVAGMAGHRLNGRIGRITGIDPAGPTFKFVSNEFRLDKSDAKFVDIIHVNGGKLSFWGYFGLQDPLGHLDFYPNGEVGKQIGCPIERSLIYETLWCSHGRGVKYFTESIFSPLAFPACRCETFDKYIRGECPCTIDDTAYMGEHLSHNTTPGIYQLVTRPKPLFGHGIQLNITLHNFGQELHLDENQNKFANTDRNMVKIQHKGLTKSVNFTDTYNSKSYPNDDILKLSTMFVLNYIANGTTEELDQNSHKNDSSVITMSSITPSV